MILIGANRLLYAGPPPSISSQKQAQRQTAFNKLSDYLATVGKDSREKQEILQDRRQNRAETRLREVERRQKKAQRQRMQAQEDIIMEKERL